MPDLDANFRAVVRALVEARVPFAVCGGLAMSIHAQPRATIDIDLPRGTGVTPAARAVRATSQARELCLSLQRAVAGPGALERVRAGQVGTLSARELRLALGLAWAAGDLELVRTALATLPAERVATDPVIAALKEGTDATSTSCAPARAAEVSP